MKAILFANTDWYLYNFRRSLAEALRDAGHEVLLLSPDGRFGPRLRELGFRWEALPMDRRSLNPIRETLLLARLTGLFLRERPALVHAFTIKCAVYGSLAARMAGVEARVNAVAGLGYVFISDSVKARILRPMVRALLRLALGGPGTRLVLQNSDDVALFESSGLVAAGAARLIPSSGVDCRRFAPLPEAPCTEPKPFRVLLAARLLWDKGLAEFVAAARSLTAEGRDIEFLVAGEPDPGNPASVSPSEVQRWVHEGVIRWLGHVDDMPALLGSADVVVLPSYREGLPKSLIEAGACARPLVATDVPGCREVVRDGEDGLLIPVRDAGALADAIARLHDDPELRARLAAAARAKALTAFDERIVIARTFDVYRELGVVAGAPPSAAEAGPQGS